MTSQATSVREYQVRAGSAPTFGRVLCSARNHHFVVDGPAQNGAPGEEVTPAELFLTGIAACGVELAQSFARADQVPLRGVNVDTVVKTLVARGLITEVGEIGGAIQYGTTTEFLERLGLQSLEDLPPLAPFLPDLADVDSEGAA